MGAIAGNELAAQVERAESVESGISGGGGGGAKMERILVSVRLRPLSEKEIEREDPCDWECINDNTIIFRNSIPERSMLPTAYTFDRVFHSDCTTREVYEQGAREVALLAVTGINTSIFAYGQTSSGKTYTMNGITEYTVTDIYEYIKKHEERAFVLKFSAMEIYNEAVIDLLSGENTPLRLLDDPERGTIIEKLTEVTLRDWSHLKELISVCEAHRKIGETSLNERSSRSHQILRLTVESSATEFLGRENTSTLVASVNFVDLAGSERASQALSVGARLKEGCHINRSLLTLGTVIRKLSKGRSVHIPYRESKLTRILQPSLGGNARTAIICAICPAHSHIEQSKNTLLFASCAKEVATNARVNVVMSDKSLVKHLQRELARLENELKYPGAASNTSHFESLLREKEAHIRKMERQIRELMRERDLAQSRLQDLLRVSGNQNASTQWEELGHFSTSRATNACDDVYSVSDVSGIGYQFLDNSSTGFSTSKQINNYCGGYVDLSQKTRGSSSSLRLSSSNVSVTGPLRHHHVENCAQECYSDDESVCKEVQCIEEGETSAFRSEDQYSVLAEGKENVTTSAIVSNRNADLVPHDNSDRDTISLAAESSYNTLEQQMKNAKKTIENLGRWYPDVSSPSSVALSSSRGSVLTRSQSCRAAIMNGLSSAWFLASNQNNGTTPNSFLKDFLERPERLQRRKNILNFGDQDGTHPGLSEIDHLKSEQFIDNQEKKDALEETARSIGLDPKPDLLESPSRWPAEFERKQQDIFELWHECNVSLIHRTYFFLLFKGDPSDSIYMEVEHRRLSFIKSSLAHGLLDDVAILIGQSANLAMSSRNLRRERMILYRQMNKRLSAEERESLYIKWGIPLDSKQRRLQLVRRLWSQTKDIEHVRESASLVAKLIGLVGTGKAMKEMFGLSLAPQKFNRRFYSWKRTSSFN